MRALLLLIAGFLVFGLTVGTTVYVITVNKLKKTEPYRIALEQVVESQQVQRLLGRPVEAAWLAAGQVNDAKGYTELTLRVKGPTGEGTVRAIAERTPETADEPWELVFLDVACYSDFGVEVIELIAEKPPQGPDLPEPTEEAKERYGVSESEPATQ